jgi:hypothetical protein
VEALRVATEDSWRLEVCWIGDINDGTKCAAQAVLCVLKVGSIDALRSRGSCDEHINLYTVSLSIPSPIPSPSLMDSSNANVRKSSERSAEE